MPLSGLYNYNMGNRNLGNLSQRAGLSFDDHGTDTSFFNSYSPEGAFDTQLANYFNNRDNIPGLSSVSSSPQGLFGKFNDFLGSDTAKALSGLAGFGLDAAKAYGGFKQFGLAKKALGLAKDQYRFQKGLANRNLANQAHMVNTTYDNARNVAIGLAGIRDPETIARLQEDVKKMHVDGSKIG